MILRTDKSVLFFIPWEKHWIVGTTDTDFSGDRAEPEATEEDIEYILAAANRVLARPLTRADVIAVYAGLRPLVDPSETGTAPSPPPSCPGSTWSTCRSPAWPASRAASSPPTG